jgi:hypothetical protein
MKLIASSLVCGLLCAACSGGANSRAEQKPALEVPLATPAPVAPPAVSPATDPSSLLRGEIPQSNHAAVLSARCESCHTLEYVTQQRLSDTQWDKTLTKMQKWGSPLTDEEKKNLVPYLATTWIKTLRDRVSPRVATPQGAMPQARRP